jgi:hypothetical protein
MRGSATGKESKAALSSDVKKTSVSTRKSAEVCGGPVADRKRLLLKLIGPWRSAVGDLSSAVSPG